MTGLTEDYLREVETSLRADADRRRQIIDELRSHLQDKINDLRAADPEKTYEALEREVLADFGSPRDLALAYEPEGSAVLKNKAGDTVLRLSEALGRGAAYVATDLGPRAARAVGRGARVVGRNSGRLLKGVAITLAVLLVTTLGVGAWAYYEFKPYVLAAAEDSIPIYEERLTCATMCEMGGDHERFSVKSTAKNVRFELSVHALWDANEAHHYGAGNASVVILDAVGKQVYNRTFNVINGTSVHQTLTWDAVPGDWTVAYQLDGFVGEFSVRTYATSLGAPWDF